MSCMRHIDHLDSCVGCAQEDRKTAAARISQLESENGKLRAQLEAGREIEQMHTGEFQNGWLWGPWFLRAEDALAKWKEAGR
jgi:hypothetical protein